MALIQTWASVTFSSIAANSARRSRRWVAMAEEQLQRRRQTGHNFSSTAPGTLSSLRCLQLTGTEEATMQFPETGSNPRATPREANDRSRRVIVLTGVAKGLGKALALELASRGHVIVGCGRDKDRLAALGTQLEGSKHLLEIVDVTSDKSVEEFAKSVIETIGAPDILVNNAGMINKNAKLWEIPCHEFDAVMDINLKGTANVIRHFVPQMIAKKKGIIVNISSGWGRSAAADVSAYCASKWAIEGLTRSLSKELPNGLAVIALNPGVINTDMLASCFGVTAAMYQTPEAWAPNAANLILGLTTTDNGSSLTV